MGLQTEIIVVDNASTDDSLCYLRPKFSNVIFLENKRNVGFAKACNMGVEKSSGDVILFLNPDTIVAEDTLHCCRRFFETHADAGALGVRMLDGAGTFLKESKRSFPGPLTSFYKLTGFARLFPHSKTFGRYHLGYLDAHQNHQVDVLAGAFMMVRKTVLEKVGAFDEAFFMYGEDVDLSYRIQKAGYKNYYIAETEIIHFKGESTKRGSLNYVRMFYSAMSTFVRKHYGGSRAAVFNVAIHIAIWMRALFSALAKVVSWIGLPVLDAVLFLFSFWAVKLFWAGVVRPHIHYPEALLLVAFPAFTFLYLVVAYYAGLYDKQYKPGNLLRAAVLATLVLLALYALLPEQYRFSRGILVFGALLAMACMSALRWSLTNAGVLQPAIYRDTKPYILVVGTAAEYEEVKKLLKGHSKVMGRVAVREDGADRLGTLATLDSTAAALNAHEVIFCTGTVSNKELITIVQTLKRGLRLRFHAAGSGSIVGSDSSTASGQALSAAPLFHLAMPRQRRLKRLIDVTTALLFIGFFPVHFFLLRKPLRLLGNAMRVLCGQRTWIGYAAQTAELPPLRPAVLTSDGVAPYGVLKKLDDSHSGIDFWYARNWEPRQDLVLIFKNYRRLSS